MHRLTVDVKKGLSFARDLSTKTLRILTYVFDWLYYQSPSSSLCTVFDPISINIKELRSIKRSANVFVFGDFNAHSKYWLTCCGGTDRTG